jgi:hypothetical protein
MSAQVSNSTREAASSHLASKDELEQVRELLQVQQQQIEQQRQELDQLRAQLKQLVDATLQAKAGPLETEPAVLLARSQEESGVTPTRTASAAERASAYQPKPTIAIENLLGKFRFTGDIRVRSDSLFQNCAACLARNRARLRVRFGIESKLNDDFTAGFSLNTGSLGDANSTNETLTNFFNRKTIAVDRGYITYQPATHSWLQITGGKFDYTWQRTSATFDPDINPEGFSEKLSFDLGTPRLRNVTLQGLQLLYSENNSGKFLAGHDSFAVGAQLSAKLDLGFMISTPSFLVLNWRNTDAILNASAFAVQAATTGSGPTVTPSVGPFPTSGEGPGCASGFGLPAVPPCVFGPQGFTNATFTDSSGNLHFLSGFLYADFILNNQIKTGIERFPLNLLLEYHNNLNAADHPLDASGNLTNLGKQSHAYLLDVGFGQLKNRNDVQFGYAFQRQEQDSILASFAESEQRAPTNIVQHRIYASWRVRPSVTATHALWVGRTLNSGLEHAAVAPQTAPGTREPWLRRVQFDLTYAF